MANGVSKSANRNTNEFKIEAVKQVAERGFPVPEMPKRLGVIALDNAAMNDLIAKKL
jgi:hypothetical protein